MIDLRNLTKDEKIKTITDNLYYKSNSLSFNRLNNIINNIQESIYFITNTTWVKHDSKTYYVYDMTFESEKQLFDFFKEKSVSEFCVIHSITKGYKKSFTLLHTNSDIDWSYNHKEITIKAYFFEDRQKLRNDKILKILE